MANTYVNKVQLADGTSLIDISDTTATADKILSGYTAYGADGSKLTGTATGGGGSVTQDQDGFIVLPNTGGGSTPSGSTNSVCGTFTTGSTGGVAETVTIPYTGSGFPTTVSICCSEGAKNVNGTAYSTVHRYAIVAAYIIKDTNQPPTYGSIDDNGKAAYAYYYKSSSTSGSSVSFTTGSGQGIVNATAWSSQGGAIQIASNTALSVFISSTSFGLLPGTEYTYCIGYSS